MPEPQHNMDLDTKMALDFLPRASKAISPDELSVLKNSLQALKEDMTAGLVIVPAYANLILAREFPLIYLRFRFDYNIWKCWVVEKWCDDEFNAWVIIFKHLDANSKPYLRLQEDDVQGIVKILHSSYVGNLTPLQLKEKMEKKAKATKDSREKRLNDRILTRVDDLSTKRLDTMRDGLKALSTGEKITAHGQDEVTLERMYSETNKRLRDGTLHLSTPAQCLNPHMNPTRKRV